MTTLPISIPYTFAASTTSIPLSYLDSNFSTLTTALNGIGSGTTPLTSVTITGGTITGVSGVPTLDANNNLSIAGVVQMGSSFLRNRIINGAMAIDQRNAGAAQTITTAAAAYTVDRWLASCTGANVTGQRVAGSGSTQYRYQFTGAASVTAINFTQRIEQLNSYDLAGSTITISVDLANSLLTSVSWALSYANTADTFSATTSISSGTFTVSSTVTRYSVQVLLPAGATTGLQLQLSVGAQTSGTWTIGNVQVEAGTIATPFERRPQGQEFLLCQRYYEQDLLTNGPAGYVAFSWNGITTNGALYFGTRPFQVAKRASPTVLILNNYRVGFNTPAINTTSISSFMASAIANTGGDSAFGFTWSASAEL